MAEDTPRIGKVVLRDRDIPRYDVELGQVRLYKRGDACAAQGARRNHIVSMRAHRGKPIYRLAVFAPSIRRDEMVMDIDSIYELFGEDIAGTDDTRRSKGEETRVVVFDAGPGGIDVRARKGLFGWLFLLRLGLGHPDRTVRLAVNLGMVALLLGIISVVLAVVGLFAGS